jgi:hypothetical protein
VRRLSISCNQVRRSSSAPHQPPTTDSIASFPDQFSSIDCHSRAPCELANATPLLSGQDPAKIPAPTTVALYKVVAHTRTNPAFPARIRQPDARPSRVLFRIARVSLGKQTGVGNDHTRLLLPVR